MNTLTAAEHADAKPGLPVGFLCLKCGYDMAGSPTSRCPECGREFCEPDIKTHRLRQQVVRRVRRRFLAWLIVLVAIVGFAVFGVGSTRFVWLPFFALFVVGAMGTLGGFALGALLCRLASPGTRSLHLWAWLRAQWGAQLPWILVAVGAMILAPAAFFVRFLDIDRLNRALNAAPILGGIAWLAIVLAFRVAWRRRFSEVAHDLDLEPCSAQRAIVVAGWLTFAASIVLGVTGGVLAAVWSKYIQSRY